MSFLITFEGIEGSGKSTQIRLLDDFLKLRGYKTLLTREPGGTVIGDKIRQILLDPQNKEMVPMCELLLYAAARAQHIEKVIQPALKDGKIVLCDRFTDATCAYQGHARGFSLDLIGKLNKLAAGNTKPKITFLLDFKPEEGLKRAMARNDAIKTGPDEGRFENETLIFHKKVREGYLERAKEEPKRVIVIKASQDVETIHQEIVEKMLEVL